MKRKMKKRKELAVTSEQLAKSNENQSVTFEVKNVGLIFCPLPIANWQLVLRHALCRFTINN